MLRERLGTGFLDVFLQKVCQMTRLPLGRWVRHFVLYKVELTLFLGKRCWWQRASSISLCFRGVMDGWRMGAWTFFPEAVEIRCSFEGGGGSFYIHIWQTWRVSTCEVDPTNIFRSEIDNHSCIVNTSEQVHLFRLDAASDISISHQCISSF